MPPDQLASQRPALGLVFSPWSVAVGRLTAAWTVLFAVTWPQWREMAHQWWDIDTYAHILLIPPILAWLVWLRRAALAQLAPEAWWPGLGVVGGGLALWLAGIKADINLVANAGAVASIAGATVCLLGARVMLILAFPLLYSGFLVPFGDEIVVPLQQVTARIAVALTHASGVPAVIDGFFIDTPAGRFVVAEECSGVKFLIAMAALSVLVAWTSFVSWGRRIAFVVVAAVTSILANGVRAWGTIFVAQFVGAERAGGFDHIVYGWVFFAVVVTAVLGIAWRFFERDAADAGLGVAQATGMARRIGGKAIAPNLALALVVAAGIVFAVLARLG